MSNQPGRVVTALLYTPKKQHGYEYDGMDGELAGVYEYWEDAQREATRLNKAFPNARVVYFIRLVRVR